MLESLKKIKNLLERNKKVDKDKGNLFVRSLIEDGDVEMIAICVCAISGISIDEIKVLLNALINNISEEDIDILNDLITVLNRKPFYIRYEIMDKISQLEEIRNSYYIKENGISF